MTNKLKVNLTGVPRTLLLPLLGRALVSQNNKSNFYDEHALKIFSSLDVDFSEFLENLPEERLVWATERAIYLDNQIRAFIKTHPKATIVNIGAGLETSFYRVDNGQLTWIDLDVPEVIDLRKQLLPATKRVHMIAKSVFDYSWMDDVKKLGNEDLFIFAGGVFIYFTDAQNKEIFTQMANSFKKATVVFDTLDHENLPAANQMLRQLNIHDANLQWGFNLGEVQTWAPNLTCSQHSQFTPPHLLKDLEHFPAYMTTVHISAI